MVAEIKSKIETFDEKYGILVKWIWRAVFYPIVALALYAGTAYLNSNYVKQSDFLEYKKSLTTESKQQFAEVNVKLDMLLLRDASGSEKFNDFERRISRLENKSDGGK